MQVYKTDEKRKKTKWATCSNLKCSMEAWNVGLENVYNMHY